jgi:hypothetical protein
MIDQNSYSFSICTLVKDKKKYDQFLYSLDKNNFIEPKDQILSIDNTNSNVHNCYSAIKEFIKISANEYIVISHDDVIINNSRDELISQIKKIELFDASVAVFGIAGIYRNHFSGVGHFFDDKGEEDWGFKSNGRVQSLDECFLIIKKSSGVSVSEGINSFHFYGTDICLCASKKGRRCYVINFPITHRSPGNLDKSFLIARSDYIAHLNNIGFRGLISTTCTTLYVGNSFLLNVVGEAFAIAKPILGKNPKAKYLKDQLLIRLNSNKFMRLAVLVLSNVVVFYYKTNNYFSCKRIINDISWWKQNWKKRLF